MRKRIRRKKKTGKGKLKKLTVKISKPIIKTESIGFVKRIKRLFRR